MLVYAEDPSTYPTAWENIVYRYMAENLASVESSIRATHLEYDSDVRCAIEGHLGPCYSMELYQQLTAVASSMDIVCYHATKVLNPNQIKRDGLKANAWDYYSFSLRESLVALGVSKINEVLRCVHDEYERKYMFSDRKPQLCFFSGLQLADGGSSAGYDQFCQNIGGELAKWALKDSFPEVYKKLKSNGVQLLAKFALPFQDIADYKKEAILYQFVCYFAAKHYWNWEYTVGFEGITNTDIAPAKILEIVEYRKEVDYE